MVRSCIVIVDGMKYKGERNRRKVLLAVFFTACVILAGTYTVSSDDTIWPVLNFILPTPDNGNSQSVTNVSINISITEENLDEVRFKWAGTNYTMYDDHLVLMMNFDNISALGESNIKAVDLTGNGNNGTVASGTIWDSYGKYGGRFDFDGTAGYIDILHSDSLNIENEITVSSWINADTWGTNYWEGTIVGKDDWADGNSHGYVLRAGNEGKLSFVIAKDNSAEWPEALTDSLMSTGTWYHATGTFNGTDLKAYINGELKKTTTIASTLIETSTYNLNIGKGPFVPEVNNRRFKGKIDEVRIWNRSLSSDEVYQQYISNLNKFNQSQWYLYVNQSKNATAGLDIGTYTYQAFAKDINNNVNSTEERTIYILGASPPVPELSTIILMGIGLMVLIGYRGFVRKKK